MPRAFASIAFTPSVKAAQTRYASREANSVFERSDDERNELGPREMEFIETRDSFYQATVSETGWPYVQHRGGAPGLLKVIDARTIGYVDFYGNAQYLSVGNLSVDDRVSLFLMDYPNRRRLKIWGRARVLDEGEAPDVIAQLEVPHYRAIVERAVVIRVEAFDWNCPQHITPRYTQAQVDALVAERLSKQQFVKSQPLELGTGEWPLVVTGLRQLTSRVRAYELRHINGERVPDAAPGSHLRVPVETANGLVERHYSIVRQSRSRDAYEIAVLRHDAGAGSGFVHERFEVGTILHLHAPANFFPLHEGAAPAVLLAGGIGITPLMSMAAALKHRGTPFQLHYAARSASEMAYRNELTEACGSELTTYLSDERQRLAFAQVLSTASPDAQFYACGPARFISELLATAETLHIARERIHLERFTAPDQQADDQAFTVELRRARRSLKVDRGATILSTLRQHGIDAPADCEVGTCATCAVKVIDGEPDHRDQVLTDVERRTHRLMCICVSRARSNTLVLDL